MVITNAYIYPVEGDPIPQGYLRFSETIEAFGPMTEYVPAENEQTFNAGGEWLLPGLVDIHTHLGLFGDGVGFEAEDCNEIGEPITPHLRAVDGINPMDATFRESLEAAAGKAVGSMWGAE